ncbi:MAG: hypothetical protein AB4042_08740 [Leptolyngbyaceae cyanobacterium]
MHQHIVEICQTLVKAGAVPGADFSVDPANGGLRLNEVGYRLLSRLFPDIEWEDVTQRVQADSQSTMQELHHRLGTNFVDRILSCIQQRVSDLPPAQATCYLTHILTGVEYRTGISLYHLLLQTIDASRFIYLETLLADEAEIEPCNLWVGDLVWAAGGDRTEVESDGDDVILTERGLQLFEQVWAGDNDVHEV